MVAAPGRNTAALLGSLADRCLRLGITVGDLPARAGQIPAAAYRADFRVERPHVGGFTGTDVDGILRRRGITDLIFAGFPFELGADCTMRQANDLGYECLAITDCCTGVTPETLAGAMSSIQMSGGIFGAVATTDALFELFATTDERAAFSARGA